MEAVSFGRRSRVAAAAVAISCCLLLTSCFSFSTDTNTVVAGNIAYVYFKKVATDQVVDILHYQINGANERKTLSAMLTWIRSNLITSKLGQVGFAISDFDYFFDPDNDTDFGSAAADVRHTPRCLVMHRNLNPIGDRHNWTFREDADRYCVNGKGY